VLTEDLDRHPDDIPACVGPGVAPATDGWRPNPSRLGRIRASKHARFVLNEIVLRLAAGLEPTRAVAAPSLSIDNLGGGHY
jgi:hypothetical protein